MRSDAPSVQPDTLAEWRSWLVREHAASAGVWLVIYKKSSGKRVFSFDEAIEEALCFGWIDSKPGRVDDKRTKLWFTPRKPGTGWSRINKDRIARVIDDGRMTEAGMLKIDAAKKDGSWSMLDSVDALQAPADLKAAFVAHPGSQVNFDNFPKSVRRGILEWIVQAKRPETRAKRIEETARLAAENKRANQWPRQ